MSRIECPQNRLFHRLTLRLFFCLCFIFNSVALPAGPLPVQDSNSRYFRDASGKAVYVPAAYLKGVGDLSIQSISDVSSYLDLLQRQNQNLVGLSAWEMAATSTAGFGSFVLPYERTGPGVALDGSQKFDLSRFNQAYFDWLRSVVLEARQRGIYVGVTLFKGLSSQRAIGSVNPLVSHPFHSANNINGIENDPNRNGSDEEAYSLAVPAITALQEEYIRKVVDTLNDLDNVLYQISEESLPETLLWQNYMVDYLQNYQTSKANQHSVVTSDPSPKAGGSARSLRNSADTSLVQSTDDQASAKGRNKKKNASTQLRTPTVSAPTVTPNGGTYAEPLAVGLQTSTSGATIYYTIDGSSPTESSKKYEGRFTISNTTLVKAKAFKAGSSPSAETSAWFTKTDGPVNMGSSGLVAHWKFDEGTGTSAADSSGNGNTAKLINGPLWTAGKIGKALQFDGTDDNVTVAHSNSLDLSKSFTLTAWVNPSSTFTDFRSILVKNYKYYLYASVAGYCGNGSPLGGFEGATDNMVCQPFQLATNTWTHLALTHNGSTLTLYKDAVPVASSDASGAPSPTSGTLQIGGSQFGEYFKGLIDEVRVYNKALSDQEVHTIYEEGSGGVAQIAATSLPQNGFAPAAPFDFSLSNSGDVTVDVGSSVTSSIKTSLTSGSTQSVTFSIAGLPSGATASFSDSTCEPACSTIVTIATAGSTPAGNFPVTVTASGGDMNKTTVFTLTALLTVAGPAVSQNGSNPSNESSSSSKIVAPLPLPPKAGNIYYVATNGSDSNTCTQAQNLQTPKRTIAAGITCLRANPLGNRLEIRSGTYAERLSNRDGITWPAGTSWNNAPTIAAFSGETVTVQPGRGTVGEVIGMTSPSTQYLIFDGIIFDAINVDDSNPDPSFGPRNGNVVSVHSGAGNIKFVNCEIKNAGAMGIHGIVKGLLWIAFSKIHHNGDSLGDHGIYAVGDFLIESSEFYNNSGYGLQLYPTASTGTIRGNFIHSNASGITVVGTFDIHNNVIANQDTGIDMGRGSLNGRIYNNTFYNLKVRGIQIGYWYDGVESVSGATGTIVRNNIYQGMPMRLDLQSRSSITQNDELCYNVATPTGCQITSSEPVNQSALWSPIMFQ